MKKYQSNTKLSTKKQPLVVIAGIPKSGKTSFFHVFQKNIEPWAAYPQSQGRVSASLTLNAQSVAVQIELVDYNYRDYFKLQQDEIGALSKADILLLIFDITSKQETESISQLYDLLWRRPLQIIFVGNKEDVLKDYERDEALERLEGLRERCPGAVVCPVSTELNLGFELLQYKISELIANPALQGEVSTPYNQRLGLFKRMLACCKKRDRLNDSLNLQLQVGNERGMQ